MNVVLLAVAFYGGFFLLFTLPVIIFIVKNARKNGRLNDITQSAEIMCRLADILYQLTYQYLL